MGGRGEVQKGLAAQSINLLCCMFCTGAQCLEGACCKAETGGTQRAFCLLPPAGPIWGSPQAVPPEVSVPFCIHVCVMCARACAPRCLLLLSGKDPEPLHEV